MIPIQTLYCSDSAPTTAFGPWMPRGADFARFMLEVPLMSSTSSLLVLGIQMLHKNRDETGDGSSVGPLVAINGSMLSSDTRFIFEVTDGFKELVRYSFALINVGGAGAAWATFRTLAPVWYSQI